MGFSFGDITGAITGQVGDVLQQTGVAPYLTDIGNTGMSLFHSGANLFTNITGAVSNLANNLGNVLSGDTFYLFLIVAGAGILIYAYNSSK